MLKIIALILVIDVLVDLVVIYKLGALSDFLRRMGFVKGRR